MKYSVRWVTKAEFELARLWLNAADRAAITSAANEIDARLAINPDVEGESRSGGRRILLVAPLGGTYDVRHADRVVLVLDVWKFEKRARQP